MRTIIIAACFAALSFFSFANNIENQLLIKLANHNTWLKLVHYERANLDQSQLTSAIHSDAFFLAADGKSNPISELLATHEAMSKPVVGSDSNTHAQCRFPARLLWLKKQAPELTTLYPLVNCHKYQEWHNNNTTSSISIVYATGYLGNPASYYGHTLLKLNSANERKDVSLVDVTVNYGAIVPDGENPVSYIVKGMAGGYDGGFSHIDYYYHTHNYGENELRDLWEYELDLSQEDVDFIVAHSWEVLGKEYTYYFFRQNCGYRMAELIEIVGDLDIIPKNPVYLMPQSLIKKISETKYQGKDLVRNIKRLPSRQAKLNETFSSLSAGEKLLVRKVTEQKLSIDQQLIANVSLESQFRILDTLQHYYKYLIISDPDNEAFYAKQYQSVLLLRFTIPSGNADYSEFEKQPPNNGRAPSYTSLTWGKDQSEQTFYDVRIRPTYYDELDAEPTHIENALLSMGDITLRVSDSKVELKNLDFVRVHNLSPEATGLPNDEGEAWRFGLGFKQSTFNCEDCLVLRLDGDIGMATRVTDNLTLVGYLGGAIHDNKHNNGNIFTRASALMIAEISDDIKAKLSVTNRLHLNGKLNSERAVDLEVRSRMSRNSDFRFMFSHRDSNEFSISYGVYW